jgi:hypothetical protein
MWHAWEREKVYNVLIGKLEEKRPLERPRLRWEDGIKMDLRGDWLGGVEWIQLAQDRDRWRAVVNAVMNLRVLAPRSQLCPQVLTRLIIKTFSINDSFLHRFVVFLFFTLTIVRPLTSDTLCQN